MTATAQPVTQPDWRRLALCAQSDPEAWFPETGDSASSRLARRVCGQCPVRGECLEFALDHHEPFGIWDGTTADQRRVLLRARRAERSAS